MNSQNHAPRRQDFQSEVSTRGVFKKMDLQDCLGGDLFSGNGCRFHGNHKHKSDSPAQSLCFCSERTAIKQQMALLARQRHVSELDATGLCIDLLFCNESATS